jgi:hypothetical protein
MVYTFFFLHLWVFFGPLGVGYGAMRILILVGERILVVRVHIWFFLMWMGSISGFSIIA